MLKINPVEPVLNTLSSFFLYIINMFHNLILPDSLANLFPLPPIALSNLSPKLCSYLTTHLGTPSLPAYSLLHPRQASLPMGSTWSITLAHPVVAQVISKSLHIFRQSTIPFPINPRSSFLNAPSEPFSITKASPLICHIIDDVTILLADWPPNLTYRWYHIMRHLLAAAGLPISPKKSPSFTTTVHTSIKFIRLHIDLAKK